jgi:hypothetical protein
MSSTIIDSKRQEFLTNRLREAIAKQPELEQLNTLLLGLGGEFLVATQTPDDFVATLLECGFLIEGPITTYMMAPGSCHRNVATLWKQRQQGIVAIATGYALSDDGLWRQHSWGILRDGLLETTEERSKYFGIVLQGLEADLFAANELGEKLPPSRTWPRFRHEVGNLSGSVHQKWQIE